LDGILAGQNFSNQQNHSKEKDTMGLSEGTRAERERGAQTQRSIKQL